MQANDQDSLWTGEMLPLDQLPRSRAPQQGFLVTANNDPFGFTEDGDVANDPWFFGGFFAPGYRAKRIKDELERLIARGDITIEDMQALQMDTHSLLADNLLGVLSEAYANLPTDDALAEFRDQPDLDRVVELITNEWDRKMDRDSAGAVAFQAFMHFTMVGIMVDDITSLGYNIVTNLQAIFLIKIADMLARGEYPNGDAVLQEGRDWILLNAVANTVTYLTARFGGVDPSGYQYSDLKRVNFDDAYGFGLPLFKKPKDGGEDTVNVSQNISFLDEVGNETDEWVTTYVSIERSVGSFKEDGTPEVWVQFPLGAHADPDSPETTQANDDWINGNYQKFLFDRDEIEAAAVEQFELELQE
jgi:penicillin amidase